MATTVASRRRARVLYAGVAAFAVLAALTARSLAIAWQARSGEARAEAVVELVGQRTAPRPTDAPGAMAWLRLELDRYARRLDPGRARTYLNLAAAGDAPPQELAAVWTALQTTVDPPRAPVDLHAAPLPASGPSLRRQWRLDLDGQPLIVTLRQGDSDRDRLALDPFIVSTAPLLTAIHRRLAESLGERPLAAVPGPRPPRPVRVYAVAENGTLISAPWTADAGSAGDAAAREAALLAARPGLPAFAPAEFFFRFDPGRPVEGQSSYSGFYLDLGGRGLVSTLMHPLGADRPSGVVAVDLAFDIDWPAFAASIDPPMSGAALQVPEGGAASWPSFAAALGADGPASLRDAIAALARRERQGGASTDRSPLRHGLIDERGAVAAFQVADTTWLLMLFPRAAPAFPTAALLLLGGLLAVLLAGFEYNRRRAEDERRSAERALAEKQNLLNTMQVPLVVVDPNTDAIVSANRAADSIGIRTGGRFADLVSADPRARAHYEKMQVATPEPRRAYGVPVTVRDAGGGRAERYALVRSVAVTAPIDALAADERHRLGILFLLERDADLALLEADIADAARGEERRRLAGLLSHGLDTLARVLEHSLTRSPERADGREFTAWLSEYLERRLAVTAWLLDHWDAAGPLPRDAVVDRDQARATVDRMRAILEHVRADRVLRSRLHWDNGTLSAPSPEGGVLDVACDWPAAFEFTLPVRGGFGLFIGEAIANAVRHGAPGTTPRLSIACDPVRRELDFRLVNEVTKRDVDHGDAPEGHGGEAYGGVAILRTLVRLFEWRDLTFERAADTFEIAWRVPVSRRSAGSDAD